MPGQPQIGTPTVAIGCDLTNLQVLDGGVPSNLIIEAGKMFEVQARFELAGIFAPWLVALPIKYTVHYYYESFGPGPEGELANKDVTTSAGKLVYNNENRVSAVLNTPGTYKLTALVSFGGAPPLTAFVEGPVIQIF